ncbi:TlpA family protein disulfide reductase [Flavivirga eckloniae]|uniref:TlpA family protein disulfide reductase n=1 Tax=Flavivirga eckloniae TaxID=1803846 RepID=A0A2K9PT20_9FLAO|nr:TlpA disulfide reductase family protein [Flavivirga eckloniae]AUP79958.1 TlpA family protein disulfide reductase [Flavivirga eckloniae]
MKKIIYLLSITITVMSCEKITTPRDYIVFSGKIENHADNKINLHITGLGPIILKEDGRFVDTIKIKNTGHYMFVDAKKNRMELYLENGNDINMTYDASDFKNTITFSGEGSAANNYLLKKEQLKTALDKSVQTDSISSIYQLDQATFKAKQIELKKSIMKVLASTEGLSEVFKTQEKRNINYEYLLDLTLLEDLHIMIKTPNFEESKDLHYELEGLSYTNDADFLFSESYKELIKFHYRKKAQKIVESEGISDEVAYLKELATLNNTFIKDSLLFENAIMYMDYFEDLDGYYSAFKTTSTNEKHIAKVTEKYNILKRVAAGSPSPKFVDYENYAGGTNSLDDFKGKYVYIDVWATWCGPCIYQMPFLDKVEKKYHGKNIQFVTISVDERKNYEKWRAFIDKEKLDGIQLLADNALESDFIKGYSIAGIPRFILIDPHGNIVNNNAPRPSDEKLIELFDELGI